MKRWYVWVAAVALIGLGGAANSRIPNPVHDAAVRWLGPPPALLGEAYASVPPVAIDFDHGTWDGLVRACVDADGWVDYACFAAKADALDRYIAAVGEAEFDDLDRNGRLALLLNAYNAFTVRLVLDHPGISSIMDIPAADRWKAARWRFAGETVSLDAMEHERIRPKFSEPRVHFALVCAAVSCPKLRSEAYVAARLESQLEDQARYTHTHPRWLRYGDGTVELTSLYDWYGGDFVQVAGSVPAYVGRYDARVTSATAIRWIPYDWALNDRRNRR